MKNKKIFQKSVSIIASMSILLCNHPLGSNAKVNDKKIKRDVEEIKKFALPVGITLVSGLAIGLGYHNYRRNVIMDRYNNNICNTIIGSSKLRFMRSVMDGSTRKVHYKNIYNSIKDSLREKRCNGQYILESNKVENGEEILVIGELGGDINLVKKAIAISLDHMMKTDGRVVFLGNIVNENKIRDNLECILSIFELKLKYKDKIAILKGEQELKMLRHQNVFFDNSKYNRFGISLNEMDQVICDCIRNMTSAIRTEKIMFGKIPREKNLINNQEIAKFFTIDKDIPRYVDSSLVVKLKNRGSEVPTASIRIEEN